MANKPLKSIKFPGLTDTYTIPQIDTSLTVEGKAADAQAVGNKFTEVSATADKAFPTDTLSGDIVTFADGADGIPMKYVVVALEPVQSGSGDPSPDNVRPISGWTGAQVVRTGVNVWDEEWESGSVSVVNGNITDANKIRSKNYIPVFSGETYYINSTSALITVIGFDKNKQGIRYLWDGMYDTIGRQNQPLVIPDGVYYLRFYTAQTTYNHDISINYPSTDHDYHSFTGNDTYPITFPSEAGIVYGGTLDVTNGTLTVDRAMVDLGTLKWAKSTATSSVGGSIFSINNASINMASRERYEPNTMVVSSLATAPADRWFVSAMLDNEISSNETATHVAASQYSDTESFKAGMSGVQLCYELATPITYTLAPTEIKSLLGDNNIWADAGDTTVTYRADTAKYIDKKIAEVVNALS